jgi:16S rRNA (guanine527-N7)-methyltransferase
MSRAVGDTPDSRSSALNAGLVALGIPASDEQRAQLLAYVDLLHKWNQAYNLSAVRDPQHMVHQHLLDCLAVLPPLDRRLQGRNVRILDVGSGAGLPGVVWALVRPQWSLCCVDAVAKKASFVRQVAAELGLRNLRAEHARVEQLQLPPFDVVVSRAFASLADFTRLTRDRLAREGCWLAMKGKLPEDEIAALGADVTVFHVEHLQVPGLDAQRCLVWMRPS